MNAPNNTIDAMAAFSPAHCSAGTMKICTKCDQWIIKGQICTDATLTQHENCASPWTNNQKSSAFPPVLDACCGTRMMWFDKKDARALFVDKRSESFRPTGVKFADKDIEVKPDVLADFKALPFPDNTFSIVVFDPPHIVRESLLGNVSKYYGALPVDWKTELSKGFAECFRVLKPEGTLIFKWCESEIPVGDILRLTPHSPLFGHRTGKAAKTHWCAFLKPNTELCSRPERSVSAIG